MRPKVGRISLGCNFRCLHCQNWGISQQIERGDFYSERELAVLIDDARRRGCRNQNWVGGDPIPHIPFWLRVLLFEKENMPVFFNTNGYYTIESAELLRGVVDVYKIDFKYGSDRCAERISDAPNYMSVLTRNLKLAKKYGELLIRILVLPNHLDCCLSNILGFIAKELGKDTRVNLMDQYTPHWRAREAPEITRRLTNAEWERALQMAESFDLSNVIT
ncbi:MAG: radical SAM protein [Candidatus Methanomethylicaceae archaeon]